MGWGRWGRWGGVGGVRKNYLHHIINYLEFFFFNQKVDYL